jgi:hypothetical protein
MKMPPNTDVLQNNSSSNPYLYAVLDAASPMTSRPDVSSPSSSNSSSSRPTLTSGAPLFSPAASAAHGLSPTPIKNTGGMNSNGGGGGGGIRVELSCERTISSVVQLVSRTFLNLLPLSSESNEHYQHHRELILCLVRFLAEVFEGALRASEDSTPPALPLQESLRECARNTIQVIRSSSSSSNSSISGSNINSTTITTGNEVISVSDALNAELATGRYESLTKISNQSL